jgi:hypothetical protein
MSWNVSPDESESRTQRRLQEDDSDGERRDGLSRLK